MKIKACLLPVVLLLYCVNSEAQIATSSANFAFEMDPEKSIITNTETSENHQTLLAAIKAADLEEILSYSGPFTVFAPSDSAFENFSNKSIAELLHANNKRELRALMTYHIIAGKFSASKILKAMCRGGVKHLFTTVQGDELIATMDGVDIVLTDSNGNTAKITYADANQCNGVIHQIDSVIQPAKM